MEFFYFSKVREKQNVNEVFFPILFFISKAHDIFLTFVNTNVPFALQQADMVTCFCELSFVILFRLRIPLRVTIFTFPPININPVSSKLNILSGELTPYLS